MSAQVLVAGWYGAGNAGDEWLLRLFRDWSMEVGATVVALSVDPAYTRAIHGVDAVDAYELPAVARAMQASDLFALGGGGLFQTHHDFTAAALYGYQPGDIASYARSVLMARQMGVPSLLWAQGVGPLDNADARAVVCDLFGRADSASVRDDASRALLDAVGVRAPVTVAPDPVWAMPLPAAPAGRDATRETIGIVPRPWPAAGWDDRLVEALVATLDPARHRLLWIPFQAHAVPGRSVSDLPLARALMERLGERFEQQLMEASEPDAVAAAIAGCDRVVAMRLHAQVLALRLGRPTLALEYDAKMAHAALAAGMPAVLRLQLDAPMERWVESMGFLLEAAAGSDEATARLAHEALRHREVLHAAIAAARRRERPRGWRAGDFDWLSTWRDGAQWRIATLEGMLAEHDAAAARASQWLEQGARTVDVMRSLNDALQVELRERDARLIAATADAQRARLAEDAVRAEREQARDDARRLRAERDQAREEAQRQRAAHDQAQAALGELRLVQAQAQADLGELRLAHAQAQADLEELRMAHAQDQAALGAARMELSVLNGERAVAQDRLREASARIDELRRSTSWRITAPLRFAVRLLRGPAQARRALLRQAGDVLRGPWRVPRAAPALPQADAEAAPAQSFDWLAIANGAQRLAIVPSAFEFDELANQRPINLAKHLAARGYTVIFAAWQWSRGEVLARSGCEVHPGVWQVDLYDLVDHCPRLGKRRDEASLFVITLPAPVLVNLHRPLRERGLAVVYDILDEWEAFAQVGQAPWFDARAEHEAVLASDAVVAVSPPLARKFASLRNDIRVIGNGYSPETLGTQHAGCARLARASGAPLTIGYFGHLTDAWFDWKLVLAAAARLPQATFELIGYGEPDWVREAVAALPNVRLPGKVPPAELWRHAARWQVALAPFQPGPLASAIDPIKAYEYLYFGLPVVCGGIAHLASLPGVRVAEGEDDFVAACLALAGAAPDNAAREAALRETTWEARFDALLATVPGHGLRSLYAA